jgi:peptidoglycan/LPS O-acetylase OafA/YrhL
MARIGALDGWRGIGLVLVIVVHVLGQQEMSRTGNLDTFGRLAVYGVTGVHFFFAISGYVITKSVLKDAQHNPDRVVRAFYFRRLARIAPPLLIYLGTTAILGATEVIAHRPIDSLKAALFICNIGVADCGWYVGHTWSLAFEEQFYVLFPVILAATVLRVRIPAWIKVVVAVFALMPLLAPVSWIGGSGFIQAVLLLGGGVFFALKEDKLGPWVQNMPVVMVIVAAAGVLALPQLGTKVPDMFAKSLLLPLATCVVLFWTARHCSPAGLLCWKPLGYLGRISYSVYLWQQIPLSPSLHLSLTERFLMLGLVVLLCAVSYHTIESWFISIGRSYKASGARHPAAARALP